MNRSLKDEINNWQVCKKNMRLIFDTPNSNWSIYADKNDYLWSIANDPENGSRSSHFGDKNHILQLFASGCWLDEAVTITEEGLELFQGFYFDLYFDLYVGNAGSERRGYQRRGYHFKRD